MARREQNDLHQKERCYEFGDKSDDATIPVRERDDTPHRKAGQVCSEQMMGKTYTSDSPKEFGEPYSKEEQKAVTPVARPPKR
jgi:hypothetical protein